MYTIKRVEGYTRSNRTGADLRKVIRWHLVDANGVSRDVFAKRKDAEASAARLNRNHWDLALWETI